MENLTFCLPIGELNLAIPAMWVFTTGQAADSIKERAAKVMT